MTVLGFDTSNYTTSIAAFDGTSGENQSRLLPVKAGSWACVRRTPCLPM